PRFIHRWIEGWAAREPGRAAVAWEGGTLAYGELNARANRLAHHLRARGVGRGDRVAVCVERGPAMVVAPLAVLKAGGAYVPLDPAYPLARLHHMLEDSTPTLLLTETALAGLFAEVDVPALDLADTRAWAAEPATNPERAGTPEQLAYVIFTSGSTGRPKGVAVEHRGLCNMAAAQARTFGVAPESRVLQFASFSFDAWAFEVVMALCSGAALHLPPRGVIPAGEPLVRMLDGAGITHATLPPAVLATLPAHAELRSVQTLVLAGDVVTGALARRWARGRRLFNAYGPTEATVWSTVHEYGADEEGSPSIGRPIGNARVYVLDAAGEPAPVGVAGELHVGGAGVARGYLERPELTAERFVEDPFAGGRMYRTGDLARWLPNGTLEFLGRNDHQVKVRGYRIELGEIESRLAHYPGVREAAVLAREDVPGDRRLVAYLAAPEPLDVEALRAHLSAGLPEYMVPAAFVRLDALPLTPNGKTDRRALHAPEEAAHAVHAYEAPVGAMEEAVAAIWADLLGVERVGRLDHFFDLGGHSLLAVQVVSRVWQELDVEAEPGDLFQHPVLADFARGLEGAAPAESQGIGRAAESERQALSFAQQRLWFLEQLGGAGAAYHIPLSVRLRGALDGRALRRALDRVVARHEALRTTFAQVNGEAVQLIAPAEGSRFHLVEHDLAGSPALDRLAAEEARAPFDLAHGPLARGRLVKLADDDHVLLVTMHHIVSDGWSMGVLVGEINTLYTAFLRGEADPLPPLAIQYADYAAWQRQWLSGEVLREQGAFWKEALSGAPELLRLPTDRPRPAVQDHAGAVAAVELDAELTAALRALGQRHGTTLFMTLMAAWATVLARLSGQDDVVIGTPTANRGRPETEGLIGFFVNTLALRLDLAGEPTVAELLARVKERALSAQAHQDIPFEQVVELVRPARTRAHSPLFQVLFAWQNAPMGSLELPGLTLEAGEATSRTTAKFDLSLILQEEDGGIVGGMEYATALFDAATIERYLGYLRRVLQAMVADERQTVGRLALLGEDERRRVVEEWNATDAEYPAETGVHALFEAQARRTPGAVALVDGDVTLTYAELDARANRLARLLRERGARAGEMVAVLVPRSLELVVAELAVLKAGAAYVPIDPSFPAARIQFMVADSGARLVLARSGDVLPELAAGRMDVDTVDGPADALPEVPGNDAAAYVMYTSGSTGTPKGVVVPHRAIVRLVINNGYADFADRVAFAANPAFDATTMEVWGPLLNGGTIVVIPADVFLDADAFAHTLADHDVGVLFLTTAVFNTHARAIPGALARLRCLMAGGEAADPVSFARVLAEDGPVALVHCYGPTEAATFALTHPVAEVGEGALPLGRPISNTRVYLLDARGEPVPVGVAGEVHIGGAGVALGYLNQPALTAEHFVDDPFAGGRMYRTGDIARWLPNGTIEFLGRDDHQVKVRGYRIELGEIEARLCEHPALRQVAVLAREDVPGDKRLVAYCVGMDRVDAEVLREHLVAKLPEYMVPAAYVWLDALPLTANGKVDRRALPAPEGDAFATREYEAPTGETEEVLAGIWSEVLGVERVGRRDHFFELGGHSLLAVQLSSRVRQALGVEVALGELFARPVLADFAAGLETAGRSELPAIVPTPRGGRLALSFAQQRLWFLEQLGAAGRAYHIPIRLRLRGRLDREALGAALDRIVQRHEALRTTFHTEMGEPYQAVAQDSRFHLVDHDLRGRPEELGRLAAEEAVARFDLSRGPLVRGRLVRLGDEEHVLLVTMHHIVSDGWSMGVLTREASALYAAFRAGRADPLPPLELQYADYAAWQRG
ncbi:MAG TPA: amino acid adenylation domain-containing protein, partial [Longimicrobium sp.]